MNTNVDYQVAPFASVPPRLRAWFESVVRKAEVDAEFKLWRVVLPSGSTSEDVAVVSHSLRVLFPEQTDRETFTPVSAEFVL